MANRFALLEDLDDESFFAEVDVPLPAKGELCGGVDVLGAVKRAKDTLMFGLDLSVKRLVIAPVNTTENEVLYPPLRVRSVRDAKKLSAMRLGGFFATEEGPAVISYGSYADGDLQV